MDLKNLENELNTLHSIFSKNEERVSQLTRREFVLKKRLSEVTK